MKKFLIVFCMSLLLVASVSGYYCIEQEDNDAVKDFKYKTSVLALENDIQENGLTEEAFNTKLKYFNTCS